MMTIGRIIRVAVGGNEKRKWALYEDVRRVVARTESKAGDEEARMDWFEKEMASRGIREGR